MLDKGPLYSFIPAGSRGAPRPDYNADPPPREAHLAKSAGVFVWLLKYCGRGWEPEGLALLSEHEEEKV